MTTEDKLIKVFNILDELINNQNVSYSFKQGILAAKNTLKIRFDEELIKAGIDVRLQYEIDKENNTKN